MAEGPGLQVSANQPRLEHPFQAPEDQTPKELRQQEEKRRSFTKERRQDGASDPGDRRHNVGTGAGMAPGAQNK